MSQRFGNPKLSKVWKRWAPTNDEDPSNKILEILGVGPISTRKHECNFGSMGPISNRKHEMELWYFGIHKKILTVNV